MKNFVYQVKTAFIATPFWVSILVVMSFLSLYLHHLNSANEVHIALKERNAIFAKEATLILHLKCQLLNYGSLNDFVLDGSVVNIYTKGNAYEVYWRDLILELEIYDREIYDYTLIAFDN